MNTQYDAALAVNRDTHEEVHAAWEPQPHTTSRQAWLERQHLLEQHESLAHLIEDMARSERLDALANQMDQLAHEMGTPLSTLYGHLQLILADPSLPESLRPGLEVAAKEAVRITEVVRRHLETARNQRPRVAAIPLVGFLGELLQESTAREGRTRPFVLEVEPSAERPSVDRRTLRPLLQGLIQNLIPRLNPFEAVHCVAVRAGQDLIIRLEGGSACVFPTSSGQEPSSSIRASQSTSLSSPQALTSSAMAPFAVLEARARSEIMPPALLVRLPAFPL